jgi:prepilin-type N-terminal cleavage/methylation domain-containing protein
MKKGFTLLEILLVIAAIGILAAIVIVAINPNRQLAQARDAERQSEVNSLYKALEQYLIENGEYPRIIEESNFNQVLEICDTNIDPMTCNGSGLISLTADLVPNYLSEIPSDPNASGERTNYGVIKLDERIGIVSILPENTNFIGSNVTQSEALLVLPVSFGINAWYDAQNIDGNNNESFSNGQAVATWQDLSGNDYHATQASGTLRPTYRENQINGLSSIDFDGNNDKLVTTYTPSSGSYTYFVVFNKDITGAWNLGVSARLDGVTFPAQEGFGFYQRGDGTNAVGTESTNTFLNGDGPYNVHTPSNSVNIGNYYILSVIDTDNTQPSLLRLGGADVSEHDGDLVEVIIYNRELSLLERQRVDCYLGEKYNISVLGCVQ